MRALGLLVLSLGFCSAQTTTPSDQAARAILDKSCGGCHGAAQMSGLDLRQRDTALKGGSRGPALVPGKPAESLLYTAVLRTGDLKMPPGKQGLAPEDIATLRAWIERGATWTGSLATESSWWSFKKIKRPDPPKVEGAASPVDAFILAKLGERKLRPVALADRRTLIRRATYDLTGLPPSPADVDQFVNDAAPDAYEKLIDRLLASKHYGERWGRHWLDVARYADTGGFETDIYFPNAWRYRDYVIKSFNDDKPFNTFVQEQVAGDLLWPGDIDYEGTFEVPAPKLRKLEARIGTGMYTIGPVYHEAGLFSEQARYEWLTDVVDTTGETFLGLTLGCARCHNHKFDPLTQKDYHAMMAVFAGSEEREVPVIPRFNIYGFKSGYPTWLKVEELKAAIARIDETARQRVVDRVRSRFSKEVIAAYEVPKDKRTAEQRKLAGTLELAMTEAGLQENAEGKEADISYTEEEQQRKEKLIYQLGQATLKANPVMQTATVLGDAGWTPEVFMTRRGDWRSKGDKVNAAFPAVLANNHSVDTAQPRKALAEWLTDPEQPLTARVIANRVWHWHFGRGIVATPGDFGRQGEAPTHPELLDWLASELTTHDWSLKHLHRVIMLSDAYRRSSQPDEANSKLDADNRFLWRMNRQRADAETLRDSVLAASGRLNEKMGGRPVIPPLTKEESSGLWAHDQWPEALDTSEHNRRSVYLYVKRTFPLPMMTTFDQPDNSVSCSRRDNTTVAPQALTMMNSEFMLTQAGFLAQRARREQGADTGKQIEGVWRLLYGRMPTTGERAEALAALAKEPDAAALTRLCLVLLNTNEFLYID